MWLSDIQTELERERSMRRYTYAKLLKEGKVTEAESTLRFDRLAAAIALIETLRDAGVHQTDQLPLRLTPEVRP